jgi:hypothetical protein
MGTVYEYVFFNEISSMGFLKPPEDGSRGGDERFDIYIKELNETSAYGYTVAELMGIGRSKSSFIVMDNDYDMSQYIHNTPTENMQVTAAHEYHHAIQNGYNFLY